ncbi:MAG: hypothetical protein D8H96_19430 [Lautropia sp.]|nr:MAG: hypothetical protein D8H96_19430 [Lautropia sp.]
MNTMTVTLADVAEWLSAQFLAPPAAAMVEAARSVRGQLLLAQMGALLDRPDEMGRLRSLLSADAVPAVVQGLQRSHVVLFEGIFRNRSVAPYASVWDGTGRLFGPAVERMQRLLHDLDIRLDEDFHEPPDHLGVQLLALAEALRQPQAGLVVRVLDELAWTERFAAALGRLDGDGYFGVAARLLPPLLERAGQAVQQAALAQQDAQRAIVCTPGQVQQDASALPACDMQAQVA